MLAQQQYMKIEPVVSSAQGENQCAQPWSFKDMDLSHFAHLYFKVPYDTDTP